MNLIESQDALIIIFEQMEDFFKPLEEHAEVPMTDALQGIIVKMMVEVLEIFAIMMAEINQGQSGESIPDGMSSVVDRSSGTSRERFFEEHLQTGRSSLAFQCWRSTGRERGPWRWSGDHSGSSIDIRRLFVARVRSFVSGLISPYK